ncbi:MAG: preprotein translocase subunit SecG [Alphaproteobacteria bacterium]|nr:preprotein translocase subunit SecG [Alphaproteobacteria bacterium]
MGSVLLVIHLLACIFLVAVILLQRSTGGALDGLGGGSGASSFLNARGTGNLLTRTTAILAVILFVTSISLSLYYKGQHRQASGSILENTPAQSTPAEPQAPSVPVAGK